MAVSYAEGYPANINQAAAAALLMLRLDGRQLWATQQAWRTASAKEQT